MPGSCVGNSYTISWRYHISYTPTGQVGVVGFKVPPQTPGPELVRPLHPMVRWCQDPPILQRMRDPLHKPPDSQDSRENVQHYALMVVHRCARTGSRWP